MVGLNKCVGQLVRVGNGDWESNLSTTVYRYRLLPLAGSFSPFDLLRVALSRLLPSYCPLLLLYFTDEASRMELLSIEAVRATQVSKKSSKDLSLPFQ